MDEATIERTASGKATTQRGPLTIRRERGGNSCVIRLYGELDRATVAALDEAIADANATGASEVVLDLSALHFIDASGLRSIVLADRRARRDEQLSVHLLRGPSNVDRLFRLTGLHDSLSFLN